jgi:hypothetical protein
MRKWIEQYIKKIKEAKTDQEIEQIIASVYSLGYDDCEDENGLKEERREGRQIPWEDLD